MKLIRSKRFLRTIALFFLISILNTVIFPTVSYALTAGPTAPEYSSFEPVDTTDMVNLATGDFTYNIPLLEVPGPEGNYPLALSYHAGIEPDQEASWVGLGWTLNAGAINRMVNVYPDDINNATELVRDTWSGGQSSYLSVGIGVGPVNAGLTFANDTYKGFGVGGQVGVGIALNEGSTLVGLSAGVSPYGESSFISLGVTAGTPGSGIAQTVGVGLTLVSDNSGDHLSAYADGGVSYRGARNQLSLTGASISTNDTRASMNIGGISAQSVDQYFGHITSQNSSFSIAIPIPYTPVTLDFGYSSSRYYMDQFDRTFTYGSLYASSLPTSDISNSSFDCYSLKNPQTLAPLNSDPDREMGGSLPAYDVYYVSAQGMGGSIQPYIYENGSLFRKVGSKGVSFDYDFSPFSNKVGFRFVNDFSNSFSRSLSNNLGNTPSDFLNIPSSVGKSSLDYDQIGLNQVVADFNKSYGMLAGSKHVEWFTNREIRDGINGKAYQRGFISDVINRPSNFQSIGYTMNLDDNIGGFMVTNESGVTYHYSIPVYNFEDFSKYYNSTTAREIHKPLPYAYTWLLTGITGPDFVDRGVQGVIDDSDWGYWVKFEYGKWTDQYIWRNPSTGSHKEIDSEFGFFSTGKKELYYLDAIKTRTHTALFIKDIRTDAKGVSSIDNGGFGVSRDQNGDVTEYPVSSLKLSRILLFTNRVLSKTLENTYNNIIAYEDLRDNSNELQNAVTNSTGTFIFHQGNNLIDENDLKYNFKNVSFDISNNALRQIIFNYSNDLCKNTPNSFDIDYSSFNITNQGQGKLTLTKLEVKGKGGKSIIPPTDFTYGNNPQYDQDAKDIWGMYKSDVKSSDKDYTQQTTTQTSSQSVDAWSLTEINTSIGAQIKINYESDKYNTSVLTPFKNFPLKDISLTGTENEVKINLYSSEVISLVPELNLNNTVEIRGSLRSECPLTTGSISSTFGFSDNAALIKSTSSDYIVVTSASIYNTLLSHSGTCDNNTNTQYTSTLLGGNLLVNRITGFESFGGGLRVKSISLFADNTENVTTYAYSGGTTAYDPIDFNVHFISDPGGFESMDLKNYIYSKYLPVIANNSFLPSPGVIYSSVTVADKILDYSGSQIVEIPGVGSVKYDFTTFNNSMLPRSDEPQKTLDDGTSLKIIRLKDFRNRLGALNKITQYDAAGNILSTTLNNYLHDQSGPDFENVLNAKYDNQGKIDQVFIEKRSVDGSNQLMITEIEEYPFVPLGKVFSDNKRGIIAETRNLAFDYYTGEPISQWGKDPYSNQTIVDVIPAYVSYPELGLKINDPLNRHMLNQNSATYSYKVSSSIANPIVRSDYQNIGLIAASAQIWSDEVSVSGGVGVVSQAGIWRKQASYLWIGDDTKPLNEDGTSSINDFVPFNFNALSSNSISWEKQQEITQYDVYSHGIEAKNINGNYLSSIMDPQNKLMIASAVNSTSNTIAYSGCEFNDYYSSGNGIKEGNVSFENGEVVNDFPHTGNYSLKVEDGYKGFKYVFTPELNKKYRASVWVYLPGAAEDNVNLDNVRLQYSIGGVVKGFAGRKTGFKARSFYLINLDIDPKGSTSPIEVSCINYNADRSVYFDDFRVHPLNAGFTSYVYDLDNLMLTYILNSDNFYTRYEYDESGKLVKIYQEIFSTVEKKVSEQTYNYGKQK